MLLTAMTESQVRKELAEEETERLSGGETALHEMSASSWLILGLELENDQWVLYAKYILFLVILLSFR
jgi:hypothetical protein